MVARLYLAGRNIGLGRSFEITHGGVLILRAISKEVGDSAWPPGTWDFVNMENENDKPVRSPRTRTFRGA